MSRGSRQRAEINSCAEAFSESRISGMGRFVVDLSRLSGSPDGPRAVIQGSRSIARSMSFLKSLQLTEEICPCPTWIEQYRFSARATSSTLEPSWIPFGAEIGTLVTQPCLLVLEACNVWPVKSFLYRNGTFISSST